MRKCKVSDSDDSGDVIDDHDDNVFLKRAKRERGIVFRNFRFLILLAKKIHY